MSTEISKQSNLSIPRSLKWVGIIGGAWAILTTVGAVILFYFVFVTLMVLYEQGVVSRTAPVIWEWLAISTSIAWVLAQSSVLGRELRTEERSEK